MFFLGMCCLVAVPIFLIISIIFLFKKKVKKGLLMLGWMLVSMVLCVVFVVNSDTDDDVSSDSAAQTANSEEILYIKVKTAIYDKEKDEVKINMKTNLPNGTKVNVRIFSENNDYVDNPTVQNGVLHAVLGNQDGELVANGKYGIETMMYVNESDLNPHFYDQYGDYIDVSSLVDAEVEDYGEHYVIDFGKIGGIDVKNAHSIEEADKALKESIRKEEERDKKELEEKKQGAKEIRFAELNKNPEKYSGEFVKYQGEIIQIMEDESSSVIRLAVTMDSYGYDFNDVVYITYDGTTSFVDEDEITVYGTVKGSHTYESTAGYEITLPLIEAEIIE